jgi:hypothetical protein
MEDDLLKQQLEEIIAKHRDDCWSNDSVYTSTENIMSIAREAYELGISQPEAPAINVESRDFYELCQRYRHSQEWFPHGLTPSRTFEDIKKYIRCGETPWKESYDDPQPQNGRS